VLRVLFKLPGKVLFKGMKNVLKKSFPYELEGLRSD
jgi:hypothetical protein